MHPGLEKRLHKGADIGEKSWRMGRWKATSDRGTIIFKTIWSLCKETTRAWYVLGMVRCSRGGSIKGSHSGQWLEMCIILEGIWTFSVEELSLFVLGCTVPHYYFIFNSFSTSIKDLLVASTPKKKTQKCHKCHQIKSQKILPYQNKMG